jgi:hypothetical protein
MPFSWGIVSLGRRIHPVDMSFIMPVLENGSCAGSPARAVAKSCYPWIDPWCKNSHQLRKDHHRFTLGHFPVGRTKVRWLLLLLVVLRLLLMLVWPAMPLTQRERHATTGWGCFSTGPTIGAGVIVVLVVVALDRTSID